jgi:hypothetical protein
LTVSFRFPPPYSKYFGFSHFLDVSSVVPDRLGQCSIRKKVFYAKNDHGNHLNDDHPPEYGIHHLHIAVIDITELETGFLLFVMTNYLIISVQMCSGVTGAVGVERLQ